MHDDVGVAEAGKANAMSIIKGKPMSISGDRRFPITKASIRENFGHFNALSCYFGNLNAEFRFDSRCNHRPALTGPVVASLSFSRARSAILQLYSIAADAYPPEAVHQFQTDVISRLKFWLEQQIAKPETAVLGAEQLIVCWNGTEHDLLAVRFL